MLLKHIHQDDRGFIDILTGTLKYPEITIFKTKRGKVRGGCIHNTNDEFCVVFEGKILYVIQNEVFFLSEGDSIKIEKNSPHFFISLTDSTVGEWGATEKEKQEKHKQFRNVVDLLNE